MSKLFFSILIILWFLSLAKGGKTFTKDKTIVLKAILPIFIIAHHLSYMQCLLYFNTWGTIVNSIFFFLSGYGLLKTYSIKGTVFFDDFWSRRLTKVCIPLIIAIFLYVIIFNQYINWQNFLPDFLEGSTEYLPYSWFAYSIIIQYLFFWVSFRRRKSQISFLVMGMLVLIYVVACYLLGFARLWFYSTPAFLMGSIYAYVEERVNDITENKFTYFISSFVAISFSGFLIFYCEGTYTDILYFSVLPVTFAMILSRFNLSNVANNKQIRLLSLLSYEVYLSQGIGMSLLRGPYLYIKNDLLFIILVYPLIILIAYIIHKLCQSLIEYFNRNENITHR